LILLYWFILKIFNPDFTDFKLPKTQVFTARLWSIPQDKRSFLPSSAFYPLTVCARKADWRDFLINEECVVYSAANFAD